MIKLSRSTDYGIVLMAHLAEHEAGSVHTPGRWPSERCSRPPW